MVSTFFPKGNWIDLDTYENITITFDNDTQRLIKPRQKVIKHLRPGYSVFVQDPSSLQPLSTKDLLTLPFTVITNLDDTAAAKGSIFAQNSTNKTTSLRTTRSSIQSSPNDELAMVSEIMIFNHALLNVSQNQTLFACYADAPFSNIMDLSIEVDKTHKAIVIKATDQSKN